MYKYQIETLVHKRDEDVCIWGLSAPNGYIEKEHEHDFIELVYTKTGTAVHIIDNKEYKTSRGSMLLINKGQIHSIIKSDNCRYVNIIFKPSFICRELADSENLFGILELSMFSELKSELDTVKAEAKFEGKDMLEIEHIVDEMIKEYDGMNIGYRPVIRGYASVLLSYVLRMVRQSHDLDHYGSKISTTIIKYIDENFNQKISLSDLAEKCFYCPNYFSEVFKKCYGKSLTAYIQEKRVHKAIELFNNPDLSIEKISEMVGYHNYHLFSKIFKNLIGESPSEFRKKMSK